MALERRPAVIDPESHRDGDLFRRSRQRRLPSTLCSVHAVPEHEDPQLPTRHRRDGGKLPPVGSNAATAKPCLTKDEARKLWPNEWLYWHTERHCWDHIKGTSGTYEERQPEPTQQAANVVAAPLPNERKELAPTRNFLSNNALQ